MDLGVFPVTVPRTSESARSRPTTAITLRTTTQSRRQERPPTSPRTSETREAGRCTCKTSTARTHSSRRTKRQCSPTTAEAASSRMDQSPARRSRRPISPTRRAWGDYEDLRSVRQRPWSTPTGRTKGLDGVWRATRFSTRTPRPGIPRGSSIIIGDRLSSTAPIGRISTSRMLSMFNQTARCLLNSSGPTTRRARPRSNTTMLKSTSPQGTHRTSTEKQSMKEPSSTTDSLWTLKLQ